MTEGKAMEGQERPLTVESIARDLRELGVEPGMTLVVHSSLSALGWVSGGAQAVVLALREALGPEGTLVVPTHSTHLSEPSYWRNPPVPDPSWLDEVRASMPAYDPYGTPTRQMGAIVDAFLLGRDVHRSAHPQYSFAARGPRAREITDGHELANGLANGPLEHVYRLDGWVLLLGVGHANNTSLHLAEHRSGTRPHALQGSPVLTESGRQWVTFDDLDGDADVFDELGADFARDTGGERVGTVGRATARLMRQRALVDYGVEWLRRR